MANNVIVSPRYSKYINQEIEDALDKVHNADAEPTAESANMISSGAVHEALAGYVTKENEASEEEIRDIVRNWTPDAEPEPEEEEETPGE